MQPAQVDDWSLAGVLLTAKLQYNPSANIFDNCNEGDRDYDIHQLLNKGFSATSNV